MTLVSAMALGADCIDDCDVLRSGRTAAVLGHAVAAPSTLGTFLRAFTFGHVRQLDRVLGREPHARVGGGRRPGRRAPGRRRRFVRRRGPRPRQAGRRRSATRASAAITRSSPPAPTPARCCTSALRKGSANTSRGRAALRRRADRPRRRAPARRGPKLLRADSGFWNKKIIARLQRAGWQLLDRRAPATARSRRRSTQIDETAWQPLDGLPRRRRSRRSPRPRSATQRLIVRRARTARSPGRAVARLASYFAFVTNRTDALELVEAEHRQHAVVELAIRDLKDQALAHFPSGQLHRQRRLDGDRRARAQPAALDHAARPARPAPSAPPAPSAAGCSRSPAA